MSNNNKDKQEWYVIVENINSRRIETYNIFNHIGFVNDCDKAWKANYKNHEEGFYKFEEAVRYSLMYYFWNKCEWEVVISCFPPDDKFNPKKIDVHDQIKMNWDNFINYLWRYYKYDTPKRVLEEGE